MSDRVNTLRTGDLVDPLVALLRELAGVLAGVSALRYQQRSGPQFFGATVGGHVRHTLDHIAAVVAGLESGLVDYDHRERGTNIERDPVSAGSEIARLIRSLEALRGKDADTRVRVEVMPRGDGRTALVASSLARELAFALSHMVHHNATVRGILSAMEIETPPTFGFAPATIAHSNGSACAR